MVSGSWTELSLLLQMFHFCILGWTFGSLDFGVDDAG